jgi:hypothetical protein
VVSARFESHERGELVALPLRVACACRVAALPHSHKPEAGQSVVEGSTATNLVASSASQRLLG